MSDPLARLHARRRMSRLLRQRLRLAAAPYTALSEGGAAETAADAQLTDRASAHAQARLRQLRVARVRAGLDCVLHAPDPAPSAAPADQKGNPRAIAHLLRRAMDPRSDGPA